MSLQKSLERRSAGDLWKLEDARKLILPHIILKQRKAANTVILALLKPISEF